jgi:hypothetical protein
MNVEKYWSLASKASVSSEILTELRMDGFDQYVAPFKTIKITGVFCITLARVKFSALYNRQKNNNNSNH